jgi:glycogen synthase
MAQPEYRKMFSFFSTRGDQSDCSDIPRNRLHLVRDRIFYYSDDIDVNRDGENIKISIALQREIIHQLIPMIQPDLIHCHDWMTGLIPAAARGMGIPCLFTVYDTRSKQTPLSCIEDMGIDAACFWENLFYHRMPLCYEETRKSNPVDLLLSGILAADFVNAASLGFASEVLICQAGDNKTTLRQLLRTKCQRGCVSCKYKGTPDTREYIDIYNALLN